MKENKEENYFDRNNRPCFKEKGIKQDTLETSMPLNYLMHSPKKEQQINQEKDLILLLHGYANNSHFMMNSFKDLIIKKFNDSKIILSINAPFPIIIKNKVRFAWYLFDQTRQKYYITQDIPTSFIINALKKLNLEKKALTIIGYSQGGYLAPFVGVKSNQTKQIIGINSCFKHNYLPKNFDFKIDAIHGREDIIVDYKRSLNSHKKIINNQNRGEFISIPNQHHRLTQEMCQACIDLIN